MENDLYEEIKSIYLQKKLITFFRTNVERIQKLYDDIPFNQEINWEDFKLFEIEDIPISVGSIAHCLINIPELDRITQCIKGKLECLISNIKINPIKHCLNIGERVSKSKNCYNVTVENWSNVVHKLDLSKIYLTFHQIIKCNLINFYFQSEEMKIQYHLELHSHESVEFYLQIISKDESMEIKASNQGDQFFFNFLNKSSCVQNVLEEEITHKLGMIIKYKKNQNKFEGAYNYTESNYEEYEHLDKYSYGKKSYSNSEKRSFYEEWKKFNLHSGHEIKIKRYLNDGYGLIIDELLGHKETEGRRSYEFHDATYRSVTNGEINTIKKGYDEENEWTSKSSINKSGHLVENWGKNRNGNEWYEKWFEGSNEKYCYKKGQNPTEHWEEEWKTLIYEQMTENFCEKKCKHLEEEWFETWSEKIYDTRKPEKTCYKMNNRKGLKTEFYWGDVQVKGGNEMFHYYEHKENDVRKEYRNNYY